MTFKSRLLFLTVIMFVFALAAACGDNGDTTAKDVKKDAAQAVDTAVQYTKEQKEKFVKEAGQHWDSLKANVEQLQEKVDEHMAKAGDKASQEWKEIKEELRMKEETVNRCYGDLKKASGETYEAAKQKLEDALADLKAAYEKAASKLLNG
ncbi:hypothetical protein AAU61_11710 [Desulfocarbo indianensis]|nr:hypothetical protein AAU61_11710 [Desulfocarbo indianensis]